MRLIEIGEIVWGQGEVVWYDGSFVQKLCYARQAEVVQYKRALCPLCDD
jgi:hypothetical protein